MWCVASSLQDVVFNRSGLLACRFFIGTFEGLFRTGIVYYLSLGYIAMSWVYASSGFWVQRLLLGKASCPSRICQRSNFDGRSLTLSPLVPPVVS